MKKLKKTSLQDIYDIFLETITKHQKIFLSILFVIFVAIFATVGQTQWFKSSLLEVSNPFNGTIYPIAKSPDYTKWSGNVKTDKFSSIKDKDLVILPNYEDALKTMTTAELIKDKKVNNSKLTFPVVYLGNYENDHKEDKGSHLAVDIRVPVGTPIQSIANGIVIKVDMRNSGFGHHMCVSHMNVPDYGKSGKTTLIACYNHMDKVDVSEGQFVFKGEVIGTSGNTGTSTTPHLHFQIDRVSAPWHPWWPFSWAEAQSASLSFFDAVTVGLNKDQAAANTVNPMLWIKENYSEKGIKSNLVATTDNSVIENNHSVAEEDHSSDNEEAVKLVLTSFEITTNKDSFNTDESVSLKITAKDQNNDKIKDYKGDSIKITSNSHTAEFKDELKFLMGASKLVVKNTVAEDFEIKIKDGDTSRTTLLISKKPVVEVVETPEIKALVEYSVKYSGESFALTGSNVNFYVEIQDEEGNAVSSLDRKINIEVEGKGKISQSSIKSDDIKDGKVNLKYTGSEVELAKITILDKTYEINLIEDIKKAIAFELYINDKKIQSNTKTKVYVKAIDEDGVITPNYMPFGVIQMSFIKGEGTLYKTKLTSKDFNEGIAEVAIKVDYNDVKQIQLKAQNGVMIGETKLLSIEELKEIKSSFSDVSVNNDNYTAIQYLKNNDIIGGYKDGSFKPSKEVSRIEALKMLLLALNKNDGNKQSMNFSDTDNKEWYAEYVGRALKLGIVKGYKDGSFKPANSINRAEYYKILLPLAEVEVETFHGSPYSDVPADEWYTDYVGFAKVNNLTDATTKFNPGGNVTRGEVAETIYRLLNI